MDKMGNYVVVTPVRNEEKYIEKTMSSVLNQTFLPIEWIIVNDGSTDNTENIIDEYASRVKWIKAVHRKDRGFRKAGGGVVEAFYDGYNSLEAKDWNFVVKLDGDLSFADDYFEKCIAKFSKEQKLGIGGGTICNLENGKPEVDSPGDPPFHVRGATKIYRRECWEKIGPLVKAPGWDTIDELKANMHGWNTRTFPDLKVIHHKPTGEADGCWRDWFKNGRANYITGYHPAFMLAKCIKRAFQIPPFFEAMGIMSGYITGYLKRVPQVEEQDLILYIRREQINKLLLRPSIWM